MEKPVKNNYILPMALILIGVAAGIFLVFNLKNNFTLSLILLFFPILAIVIGFNLILNTKRKKQ